MKRSLCLLAVIFATVFGATSGQNAQPSITVRATRITNRAAPLMDGVLEEVWQSAGKVAFPNPDGGKFTIDYQRYDQVNPSTFTVYFLHDDINLYVAIETTNDSMVESSNYDQGADGLGGMAIERKGGGQSLFRLLWHQEGLDPCASIPAGPPLDRERMVYDAEWRSALRGTWNENSNADGGYTFEFSIPLNDPLSGGNQGLGGWKAGDQIKANIMLVDHDSKPGGAFNDRMVNFAKFWWGKDSAEDLSASRWILLSDAAPIGSPGDDRQAVAQRILPSAAPVIDGNPDDAIWQQGARLRFPNSTGKTFSLSKSRYNADDPSGYTLYFLHDDKYLYVAARSDDRKIESAEYDQASDGLISLVFETRDAEGRRGDLRYSTYWSQLDKWERRRLNEKRRDCDGTEQEEANLHFQQGPPLYPYGAEHVQWAPSISGTWNDDRDADAGYSFEYKIPLDRLGNYRIGELIPANIVLIDHDSNPNGAFDACNTNFKKMWWGFDGNEFYPPENNGLRRIIPSDEQRFLVLGGGAAAGGDDPALTPAARAIRYIAGQQVAYSGLLRSFPGEMAAHTYDNAVALIALTDAGKQAEAQRLAQALIGVMETNGSAGFFYDAYNVVDRRVGQGTNSGAGPNAWAGFALAFYGLSYSDGNATKAAKRVTQWMIERLYDPNDGGIWGGICHPFEELPGTHYGDRRFDFKSTEQVLDAWHLVRILNRDDLATGMMKWLTASGRGWVEADGRTNDPCRQDFRFSTGADSRGNQDLSLFLDPQSWGAIFAALANDFDKANGAITAAERHMQATAVVNGQTITGFNDSCWPKDGIIWYGGTAQMVVSYVFNNRNDEAARYLAQLARAQNADGSWNHSSADSSADGSFHRAKPHVGETAWNYFALVDVNEGQRLPYIQRSRR